MVSRSRYEYQFRLVLVGDSTVGKTSLLHHFKGNEDIANLSITVGVDFHSRNININGQKVKLQLWDTAGQDRYRAIARSYFRNAVGALLVFDITQRTSFDGLERWIHEAKECSNEHNIVFLLVGNKCDLNNMRVVTQEEGQAFADKHGMEYIETSAKCGINVDETFHLLGSTILSMMEVGAISAHNTDRDTWDGVKQGNIDLNASLISVDSGDISSCLADVNNVTNNPSRRCC